MFQRRRGDGQLALPSEDAEHGGAALGRAGRLRVRAAHAHRAPRAAAARAAPRAQPAR